MPTVLRSIDPSDIVTKVGVFHLAINDFVFEVQFLFWFESL